MSPIRWIILATIASLIASVVVAALTNRRQEPYIED